MKRKVLCFVLTLLAIAVFSIGCGGGGGHSNPASPVISGNAKVSGVVVDSNNKPVADAKVKLVLQSNNPLKSLPTNIANTFRLAVSDNTTEFNTTTDKNGVYSFSNVPYGRYSLSVDDGDQGAYLANINVSEDDTSISGVTVTPFGSVTGTVKDDKGNLVYGAMVTAIERSAFTNEDGQFTITHIPLGAQNVELVTELQGYEATETTTFTISTSNDNLTLTLDEPIILKPSVVNSYKVPVIVTAGTSTGTTGSSISYPVLIIAEDATDEKNFFFNVLKEGDASCTLRITKTGTYALTAIAYNRDEAKASKSLAVTKDLIEGNVTSSDDFTISFATSSSDDGIKVNIVKLSLPHGMGDGGQNSFYDEDNFAASYYDGYISNYAPGYGWTYGKITDSSINWENKQNEEMLAGNAFTYGNSVAYFIFNQGEDSPIIWETGDEDNSITLPYRKNDEAYSLSEYNTHFAFIPDEFITVSYQYDCSSPRVYLEVYNTKQLTTPCVTLVNGEEYSTESSSNLKANIPYDFRMARDGVNGNCYLAVLYSDAFNGLKIYNITNLSSSSAGTTVTAVVENQNIQPNNMKKFQILKDASNNTLFYVEGSSTNGNVQSYVIDSSSQIKFRDTSSTNKSCYIDSKGCMYRYVPATETTSGENEDSRKIIKITSPFDTNQSSATSTLDLVEGSLKNEEIDGIIGFEETADQLTIYAY